MRFKHNALVAVQKAFRRAGFDLTRRDYNSPIPQDLPDSIWGRARPMHGIHFDLDAQMQWVERMVLPYADEFRPPIQLPGCGEFVYDNGSFGHGDADVLYGVVRSFKPTRIVELGSGNSSVVIRIALSRNSEVGHPCAYDVYDPYPNDLLAGTDMAMDIAPIPAEAISDDKFATLEAGDLLFIDTTHTVRIGGDVVRIVLEYLPVLKPGVLVHFHDVPLPYEYDRASGVGFNWAEMYLIQAFLAFNRAFAVRASLGALARERREQFARVAPSIVHGSPISLWLERTAAPSSAWPPS